MRSPECEVIQDLISLKGRGSRASRRMIAEHVRTCESCRRLYARSQGSLAWRFSFRQVWDALDSQQRYLRWSILFLGALAAVICLIVNYAVEGALTWGWIVTAAEVTLLLPVLIYIRAYAYRFIKAMACFSVLTLLMLIVTQRVLQGMGFAGLWVWRVAIPVAVIWLGVLWLGILFTWFSRRNGFIGIGIIVLLFIPADIATGAIASGYTGRPFVIHYLSIALYLVAAITNFAFAMLYDIRERRRTS